MNSFNSIRYNLKLDNAIVFGYYSEFQFHKVQFKVVVNSETSNNSEFQFHKVQFKAMSAGM